MGRPKSGKTGRIFITILGIAFILWAASDVALGIAGKKATALITHIRREGGERNEIISGRYTYIISYTFSLPEGKKIDGFTRKIGNSVYLKADGKSTTRVRYFALFPYINALETETEPGAGQLILAGAGVFMIMAVNRRNRRIGKS